jgi:hypothetical protein
MGRLVEMVARWTGALAIAGRVGHTRSMVTRIPLTFLCLLLLGLALSGCSGCGWWWDDVIDNIPKNCRSDRVPEQK